MTMPRTTEAFKVIVLLGLTSLNSCGGKEFLQNSKHLDAKSVAKDVPVSYDKVTEWKPVIKDITTQPVPTPSILTSAIKKTFASESRETDLPLTLTAAQTQRRYLARIWLNKIHLGTGKASNSLNEQYYQTHREVLLQKKAQRTKEVLIGLLLRDIKASNDNKSESSSIVSSQQAVEQNTEPSQLSSSSVIREPKLDVALRQIERNALARVWLDKAFLNYRKPSASELEQYIATQTTSDASRKSSQFKDILVDLLIEGGLRPRSKAPVMADKSTQSTVRTKVGQENKHDLLFGPNDTIKPFVNFGMLYDSNLLRLSDSITTGSLTVADRSEVIKNITAGFMMDWKISRQQLLMKASVNQNWFQNNSNFDYSGWNIQTQWNWQLGNLFNGEIGYSNIQVLGSFAQLNTLVPNMQNKQNAFANAGYLFHPSGKVKFGIFRNETQYDDVARKDNNSIEDNAEFELQYLSPTKSLLGLRITGTEGSYPQRQFINNISLLDNAYTRMNYALIWDWHKSVKSRIEGSLGYVEQRHEHLSQRNFADIVAQVNLHWYASEKTILEFSVKREINQANNQFASFVLSQGVWMNLSWQFSPKVTLALPVSYQQQLYLGNLNTTGITQQKDDVEMVGLTLKYAPLENMTIGALLNYENRASNNAISSYETHSAGINIQAAF